MEIITRKVDGMKSFTKKEKLIKRVIRDNFPGNIREFAFGLPNSGSWD